MTTQPMSLYNLTLAKPTGINACAYGNFSRPKVQEIVVSHGKVLSLYRPDDETGRVVCVSSVDVFGVIRSLEPFRLVGGNRDYLVVGSDSGRINILQFNPDKNQWDKVHEETFGKSGCRRIVPGQYLAADPKGRAVMIGAIEKQKFVYVLNRDSHANLTISSPLEAHKAHTLVYSMIGVDVGFENPQFACIEVDYEADSEETKEKKTPVIRKNLTFYELDLGLNNVTRKWSEEIDTGSNMLIPVPGGSDGPGGVLICSENMVTWRSMDGDPVTAMLPRRFGLRDEQNVMIVSYIVHVQKELFFFLLQSEYGDIYRVTLNWEEERVADLTIKYFDTIPPATSMAVLKTGFLFSASESGNHYLFQFLGIGDDDDTAFTTASQLAESKDEEGGIKTTYFQPRYPPVNLSLIDEMESLAPITDMKVADLAKEGTPQIFTIAGTGPRSTLRVLRHGLPVTEVAVTEVPGVPQNVWAVKKNLSDQYMSYIVVSFRDATIVLSIGENVVEVSDSGFNDKTATLAVTLLGENSLLQVFSTGMRHVLGDRRVNEWKAPGKKEIRKAACNNRQVVIALSGGELVYFELDRMGHLLDVARKEIGYEVASLALPPIPEGRTRAPYMVVGGTDNVVRIFSLDPNNIMGQLTMQAQTALPTSLHVVQMTNITAGAKGITSFLYVGLETGVLVRSVIDEADFTLHDARKRFLGVRTGGVKMSSVQVQGNASLLAMSGRSWLAYQFQNRLTTTPLSYASLTDAAAFSSEQCPEGIVCISGNLLRIVTLEKIGDLFNQTSYPLRYTPRKMAVHPDNKHLVLIESDHNAYSFKVRRELLAAASGEDEDMPAADGADGQEGKEGEEKEGDAEAKQEKENKLILSESFLGVPQAGPTKWASCVRVIDPTTGETTFVQDLDDNEAAFSVAVISMISPDHKDREEPFVVVGTAQNMTVSPRAMTAAFIHVYRFVDEGRGLVLLHKTQVHDVPLAFAPFQRRLLCGVGKILRLYEMGRAKLLRKCENRTLPNTIVSLNVNLDRIIVGDMCDSFQYVKYQKNEKQFYVFADEANPRYLTASTMLDYDTMAGADKFGNFFVVRLPPDVTQRMEKDPTQGKMLVKLGPQQQAQTNIPFKVHTIVNYHVGDMITSMVRTSLVAGGNEVIVYSTIMGSIGIFEPFGNKEDVEFFSHLEMHMRQEMPPLLGRDHLSYRSYYFPVKDCVDGDLAELYTLLPYDRQNAIAEELVSNPAEVAKKLEEMRNRVM